MKAQSAATAASKRRPMAKALTLQTLAFLFTMSFVPQSFSAAKSPDMNPTGAIVYPPGTQVPDTASGSGNSGDGKSSSAITIQPNASGSGTGKSSGSE